MEPPAHVPPPRCLPVARPTEPDASITAKAHDADLCLAANHHAGTVAVGQTEREGEGSTESSAVGQTEREGEGSTEETVREKEREIEREN
jgi:hypothetical protein